MPPSGTPTIRGTGGNDTLIGTGAGETINALGGNDTITGAGGNDTMDGGVGTDTAIFSGSVDGYTIQRLQSGALQVSGADGTDQLIDIEFLRYGTTTYSTSGPVARSDAFSGSENQSLTMAVLANDQSLQIGAALVIQKLGGGTAALGDTVARTPENVAITLGANGSLLFNPGTTYDYLDQGDTYRPTFTYTVGNGTGHLATATVTLTLMGMNDAPDTPTDTNAAVNSVDEGAAKGALVGVTARAADPDDAVTYSFGFDATGAPILHDARFAIDPTTGVVSVYDGTQLEFETATSHDLTVYASDGTATSHATFTISVKNWAEGGPERVSIASDGTQGNNASDGASISADGRYVTYFSAASNLVAGDTNENKRRLCLRPADRHDRARVRREQRHPGE